MHLIVLHSSRENTLEELCLADIALVTGYESTMAAKGAIDRAELLQ